MYYSTGQFKVRVQHHRNSGKLLVSNELVSIGNCYEVSSSPLITASHTSPSPLAPDPTLNLTFDLTLSEREREERGQLVLPYHHSTRKKTALLEVSLSLSLHTHTHTHTLHVHTNSYSLTHTLPHSHTLAVHTNSQTHSYFLCTPYYWRAKRANLVILCARFFSIILYIYISFLGNAIP